MDRNSGHDELSDGALLKRLQGGDFGAFDVLFERHRRGLMAYVCGICGDRAAAEDIVQECFVELVRGVRGIDPGMGATGWLYRLARNRAIDMVRHRRVESGFRAAGIESERLSGAVGLPRDGAAAGADEIAAMKEDCGRVRAALQRLKPADRDILLMKYYGHLKFREIAAVLRRPLGTVLWRARNALKNLRGELEGGD